jgi:hypothetical protein
MAGRLLGRLEQPTRQLGLALAGDAGGDERDGRGQRGHRHQRGGYEHPVLQ